MPRAVLVVLAVAAIALALVPLRAVPSALTPYLAWVMTGVFIAAVASATRAKFPIWSAIFAAFAILFNPLWPLDIPHAQVPVVYLAAAVVTAICVIRHW